MLDVERKPHNVDNQRYDYYGYTGDFVINKPGTKILRFSTNRMKPYATIKSSVGAVIDSIH